MGRGCKSRYTIIYIPKKNNSFTTNNNKIKTLSPVGIEVY